jgi:serine/threonine protein kinase
MVDKYEHVRVLGTGTYGRAWLVKLKRTGEQFVMKEIKVANKRELEEAKTEAELLGKFCHPHIIKFVHFFFYLCLITFFP